ncbi:hypothetical protein BP00DRAFT_446670 [Aspergillus indologenus CBS 114.80]|uniref:Uncharacterized protein n=1 Tax=Aspergillus indologenus CBS 114.80 TaxID=1450541 RepID=A0A2V5J2I9_9EURO|nr:hypothetical protein BP00DRAFT_446670 [Aspergillus indologenus CBS 114.80]
MGGCRDHPSACASATLRTIDNLEVIDGASKQGIINAFCTAGRGDSRWALGRMAHCSIIGIAIVNPRAVGRAGITATYQRQPASDHPDNSSHHATVSVISRRIGRPDHRSATVDVPGDLHQQSNCSLWYHGLAGESSSDLLRCIPTAPRRCSRYLASQFQDAILPHGRIGKAQPQHGSTSCATPLRSRYGVPYILPETQSQSFSHQH